MNAMPEGFNARQYRGSRVVRNARSVSADGDNTSQRWWPLEDDLDEFLRQLNANQVWDGESGRE